MYKIFITRRIPDAGLDLLEKQKSFHVKVSPYDRVLSKREIIKMAKGCDVLLSLLTDKIDAAVMDGIGKQLKIIANYAIGFNNIDLKAAKERGIMVTNTPGPEINEAVAEHAITMLLAIAKRMVEGDVFLRRGRYKGWAPMLLLDTLVSGKTLGVIGLGAIGKAVVERAVKGFGMKAMYYDVRRDTAFEKEYKAKFVTVKEILKNADFISLHVPLNPATTHLIGKKELEMMKKTAYIINTARGPVIDEKALVAALKAKKIAGAALDVFEFEPKTVWGLTSLPNTVLTPHTASATIEARSAMAMCAAKNIIAALRGKTPPNLVKI